MKKAKAQDAFTSDCVNSAFTVINAELIRGDFDFIKFYSDVAEWWRDHKVGADRGHCDGSGGHESRRMFCRWIEIYFSTPVL